LKRSEVAGVRVLAGLWAVSEREKAGFGKGGRGGRR
jgi:hypothetical protein